MNRYVMAFLAVLLLATGANAGVFDWMKTAERPPSHLISVETLDGHAIECDCWKATRPKEYNAEIRLGFDSWDRTKSLKPFRCLCRGVKGEETLELRKIPDGANVLWLGPLREACGTPSTGLLPIDLVPIDK